MNQQFKSRGRVGKIAPNAITLLGCLVFFPRSLISEPVDLNQYLESMNRTEVSFSGKIRYDSSEDSFTFYSESRNPFRVTMDAGRKVRESIETECNDASFMVSYSDLCTISGRGTVEMRGSAIYISVEAVDHLGN